jgi:hypothetical protein
MRLVITRRFSASEWKTPTAVSFRFPVRFDRAGFRRVVAEGNAVQATSSRRRTVLDRPRNIPDSL